MMRILAAVVVTFGIVPSLALAQRIDPLIIREGTAPPREAYFDRGAARTVARLAAPRRARAVVPNLLHVADVETLSQPIALEPGGVGRIVVEGASSIRLQLRGTAPGTVIWVAGTDDAAFEPIEPSESVTWTPTTRGSTIYIAGEELENVTVVKVAAGTTGANGTGATACLRDAACTRDDEFPELRDASRAIALIRFVRGDASYVCTGGLVNDRQNSRTPYLLTAHHCISTPEEAASIEAVWDLRAETCGSDRAAPVLRTYGADLLVSSAATDVALLRLRRLPADRVFLGVETTAPAAGTVAYHLSHPEGSLQKYTAGAVHMPVTACPAAPPSRFIYVKPTAGSVTQGSSGAPLLLPGLRVAGQLLGACGPSPTDACAVYNDFVEGSIAASWPLLAPHLDPPPAPKRRTARH